MCAGSDQRRETDRRDPNAQQKGWCVYTEDETRLKAFTAQISIALENAKLFDDVQNIKNYNESILQSMSNGVVTFDEEGKVSKCNVAASKILGLRKARFAERMSPEELFGEDQGWLTERIRSVLGNR